MLAAGTQLGPYRIVAALGAGGMGEVYRAHDSRLGRDVAIKVLPARSLLSPDARARFEREARTISQLSHPHICTLFDIGREGETEFLVMELLEGETLSSRIARGALPVADVLRLGAEIASALDRAHAAGVVHRDLKPGNVMLTKTGAKLMDFGLARVGAAPASASGEALSVSPTQTQPLTGEGAIVGTFQYMAPEQLEGREADARADIWALGCVLYEMATGKRAFAGESQASLIAAILKEEPPSLTELAPLSPPALQHVVARCLAKDPADRWQSARDVASDLRWLSEPGSQSGARAVTVASSRPSTARARIPWVIAFVLAAVAVLAVGTDVLHRRGPELPPAAFEISLPASMELAEVPALSPDGRWLVFAAGDSTGVTRLWLRAMGDTRIEPLLGTEGDNTLMPFWSPDSREIGFFADRRLKRIARTGGSPTVVCETADMRGGSWNRDDVILIADSSPGIRRVAASGGTPVTVIRNDSTHAGIFLRYPLFLPDGRHFIYSRLVLGAGRNNREEIWWASLDGGAPRHVLDATSAATYAEPGQILFRRGNTLMAQSFDPRAGRVRGVPRTLVPLGAVSPLQKQGAPTFTSSIRGMLAIGRGQVGRDRLIWFDRAGRAAAAASELLPRCGWDQVSPDGGRALYDFDDPDGGGRRLWLIDLASGNGSRLTSGDDGWNGAAWAPDGRRVCFTSDPPGPSDGEELHVMALDGSEPDRRVFASGASPWVVCGCFTPDGKSVIASVIGRSGFAQNGLLATSGPAEFRPLPSGPFDVGAPVDVSPDGRWLAYASVETGRRELYVTSFPVPGVRVRVSTDGCAYDNALSGCGWTRGGRELVFVSPDNRIMAAEVGIGTPIRFEAPRELFRLPANTHGVSWTSDGNRFLLALPGEPQPPQHFTVLVNWQNEETK